MTVVVQYYAVFREQRGLAREEITTDVATAGELYAELAARFGFSLPLSLVRPAVNGAFCEHDQSLRDQDQIVFIPPVAGG